MGGADGNGMALLWQQDVEPLQPDAVAAGKHFLGAVMAPERAIGTAQAAAGAVAAVGIEQGQQLPHAAAVIGIEHGADFAAAFRGFVHLRIEQAADLVGRQAVQQLQHVGLALQRQKFLAQPPRFARHQHIDTVSITITLGQQQQGKEKAGHPGRGFAFGVQYGRGGGMAARLHETAHPRHAFGAERGRQRLVRMQHRSDQLLLGGIAPAV